MIVTNVASNSHFLYSATAHVSSGDEAVSVIVSLEQEMARVAGGCVGLAATQIGIPKSVAIIRHGGVVVNLINPSILSVERDLVSPGEGCLSLPNRRFNVPRFKTVKIKNHALWPTPMGSIPPGSNLNGVSLVGRTIQNGMFLVPVEQTFIFENPDEDWGGLICIAVQHEEEHLRGIVLDKKDGVVEDFSLATGANKVGRNDPCPCGSNKKFKKCCWTKYSDGGQ